MSSRSGKSGMSPQERAKQKRYEAEEKAKARKRDAQEKAKVAKQKRDEYLRASKEKQQDIKRRQKEAREKKLKEREDRINSRRERKTEKKGDDDDSDFTDPNTDSDDDDDDDMSVKSPKQILDELLLKATDIERVNGQAHTMLQALLNRSGGGGGSPVTIPEDGSGELKGTQDPKQNRKFPLNVRKNCRAAESKWKDAKEDVEGVLGYKLELVCDWENWYNHEKMDTHKKDNLGNIGYHNYLCSWTEGFLKFKEDSDNLDAFRVAHTSHQLHLRLGWDKSKEAKQKGGYIQQIFEGGKLIINVNPNYINSGLYELTNGDYLSNAL